ncbi:MAG: hypothetical protein OEX19_12360, partial [Gammaproteobacteria bacterium]|nr:hypothetical protein [Gammaproteobacteria bacterium]
GGAIALVTEGSTKLVGGTTPEHLNTKIPLVKPMSDWTQSVNRWEFDFSAEIGRFLNGTDYYGLDQPYRFYEHLRPLG